MRYPVAILVLAIVKGLIWTQLLPPWYGPDEIAHFDYVQELAITGRVPSAAPSRADGTDTPLEVRCSLHNVGFRTNGPLYAQPPHVPDPDPCSSPPPGEGRLPEHLTNPAGSYNPLYYALLLPSWFAAAEQPVIVRLEAVRLGSMVLGALAPVFCYLAALWAFAGDRRLAAASAIVFLLQPMESQQTALANNDTLLILTSAAFFWWLMRALKRPVRALDMAVLGSLVGIAYLSKPQGAFLAFVMLAPMLPILAKSRRIEWRRQWLVASARIAVGATAAIVIIGAGSMVQSILHGSALPAEPAAAVQEHGYRHYLEIISADTFNYLGYILVKSFWGDFAWLTVTLPEAAYQAIVAIVILAGAGLLFGLWRRKLDAFPVSVALAAVVLISLALFALEAVYFKSTGALVLQGRSFLLMLPPLVIVLTGGLTSLAPSRLRGLVASWLCSAALVLHLVSWIALLNAFYA